ncbi:enoyl-CoA hydratase/isomerase family protein [Paremcibacter congregatus]|uniref:enoyl-CoA hydratase/isomerase family protein n=1 Tax=Paremcibacter congregatus TaxID=2043170 RepID=UPI003A8FB418
MTMITHSLANGLMTITLDRPEKLNAMTQKDFASLLSTIEEFRDNDQAKVLILTGKGRAFCAGEDLNEVNEGAPDDIEKNRASVRLLQKITETLYQTDKPTIAAINGIAVGFGVEVCLSCDIRIASENSFFWLSEATRGLLPTNGAFYFLPRLIGTGAAARMMLMAEKNSAEKALSLGLVSELTSTDGLMARAEEIARGMAANYETCMTLIKKGLRQTYKKDLNEILDMEIEGTMQLALQGKIHEGAASFIKKTT